LKGFMIASTFFMETVSLEPRAVAVPRMKELAGAVPPLQLQFRAVFQQFM